MEIDLNKLQETYKKDAKEFYALRNSLCREAIFFNYDTNLNLFDSLAKSFFRQKYIKAYKTILQLSILGYRFYYDDDWDDEKFSFQTMRNGVFETTKSTDDCPNLSMIDNLNNKVANSEKYSDFNLKEFSADEIETMDLRLEKLLGNQFFIQHANSVLLEDKLENELPAKNIIQKILKI